MSAKANVGGKALTPKAKHILIVDDEESLAFFLKQSLLEVEEGWEVDTANTGEEAVVKINRNAYKLIIADLRMPGLNGLELLAMVKALEPNTRVMLMTAYGSDKVEKEASRLNVFRYVTKPFDIEEMKRWAQEAVDAAGPVKRTWAVSPRQSREREQEPVAAPPPPDPARAAKATPPAASPPEPVRAAQPSS